jgi:ABC-2 type transport system ATP-binding protein
MGVAAVSPAIEVRQLHKRYGDVPAVAGIDLDVAAGELLALLGPNGAGKTTTVEILEGHRPRTSGSVRVLGFDPETGGRAFRERIGIVLQGEAIEKELTVKEIVRLYGAMYPRRRQPGEVIEMVGLKKKATSRIKTLSGGQRRRLELALGLVGDPDLLFLDEPTTGFDPSARRQAWTVIETLRTLGKTILLTTHYMDEAQHLADRVAVIASGRIVAEGSPHTLGGRTTSASTISFRIPSGPIRLPPGIEATSSDQGGVVVRSTDPTRTLHELTSWALDHKVTLQGLTVSQPTLEDVYLELTGEAGE